MDIEKAFSSTCQVLFGQPIGELSDFAQYLKEMVDQPRQAASHLSGKKVYLSRPYGTSARFIEVNEASDRQSALSINEVKDIDSVLSALPQELAYCGNKNLGTSIDVFESDMCSDSLDILSSQNVISSKHVAYSNGVRKSEGIFGCQLGGEVGFSIHSQVFFYSKRCFDAYLCFHSSDLYCCFNCRNCTEAMFSFNQSSKRHMIGNLELEKGKYLQLKRKLTSEIAEVLKDKKSFPSVFDLLEKGAC